MLPPYASFVSFLKLTEQNLNLNAWSNLCMFIVYTNTILVVRIEIGNNTMALMSDKQSPFFTSMSMFNITD